MKRYGVLLKYFRYVEVDAESEEEAFDIAESSVCFVSDLEFDEGRIESEQEITE